MSLFAYSGDEGPNHYFSVRGPENRYYGDGYGHRSRTLDMFPTYDRYGRSQSRAVYREGHHPSVGNLDKFYPPPTIERDIYGRGFSQDNFNARDIDYRVEIRPIPRDYLRDGHRMEYSRNAGYDNTMNHRYVYDRNVRPGYDIYVRPSYDGREHRYNDHQPYDRFDRDRLYSIERFEYNTRYDGDRNQFPAIFNEPQRDSENIHFDNERRSRSDAKRVSTTSFNDKFSRKEKYVRDIKFNNSDEERHMYEAQSRNRYDAPEASKCIVAETRTYPYRDSSKDSRASSSKKQVIIQKQMPMEDKLGLDTNQSGLRKVNKTSIDVEYQSNDYKQQTKKQSFSVIESELTEVSSPKFESVTYLQKIRAHESDNVESSASFQASEEQNKLLPRRESEEQNKGLPRRKSEEQNKVLPQRESEGHEKSSSKPESDSRGNSLSGEKSEKQEMSQPRRESEISCKSLSKCEFIICEPSLPRPESGDQEKIPSGYGTDEFEQIPSMPESEIKKKSSTEPESIEKVLLIQEYSIPTKSISGTESDGRNESLTSSEYSEYSACKKDSVPDKPRKSSARIIHQESKVTFSDEDIINDDYSLDVPLKQKVEFVEKARSRSPLVDNEKRDTRVDLHVTERQVPSTERRVKIEEDPKTEIVGQNERQPTFSHLHEERSSYITSKAQSIGDDERSSVYSRNLAVRATHEILRRKYYEKSADPSVIPAWLQRGGTADSAMKISSVNGNVLRVAGIDFCCMENAEAHKTIKYELVQDIEQQSPVIRRGQTFFMNINFEERVFDSRVDNAYLSFYFGPNPSVPKQTRVVLPIIQDSDFKRVPYQWDARMTRQENNSVLIEVSVPVSCHVGMWRCVVETSLKDEPTSRSEYCCTDDMYVIFNPFNEDDAVYMADEDQRSEFVFNESGKIYTGSYRNVQGRPWIYGQFDNCILPAACVLLEMSGLSHTERGNPVKITKALASMIKCSRSGSQIEFDGETAGLIEPMYDDSFCKGNSPYLWTGSVQIIEEFLKLGGSAVKYGQCWVMAGLMTTLCRSLGLPARPVTAFVSAVDTQDTMTVDRYIDRFGGIQQDGPSSDQTGTLWTYHTWCDVWMHRADQVPEYSGWQATDPCRIFRDSRNFLKGSCGPCPVEALRKGDIGQKEDVDAFASSLDAYVRYFYEDEKSGWGYSPFNQFKCPISQYLLTKSVGKFDEEGNDDCEDLTSYYRDIERSETEKWSNFNSIRGLKDLPAYEYQAAAFNWINYNSNDTVDQKFDVTFDFKTPESVMIGQRFTVPVVITNKSSEIRTIQTNICTRSSFYTGSLGPHIKRCTRKLTLMPDQCETVSLILDHWDYEDKLLGMANIKITVTGFVQETRQSFVDEFDFLFKKPFMSIKVAEIRVGEDSEAVISFSNPVDVALTDCFLTFEVSGSVRPRTILLDRDVRPGESFTFTYQFVARKSGEHRMIVCFSSQQLTDVVGHCSVTVED